MIARRYMLRLRKDDFEDPSELAKFASVLGISLDAFQDQFSYLVDDEPVPRAFHPEDGPSLESTRG
jgi:6-phosphofructokinase 1